MEGTSGDQLSNLSAQTRSPRAHYSGLCLLAWLKENNAYTSRLSATYFILLLFVTKEKKSECLGTNFLLLLHFILFFFVEKDNEYKLWETVLQFRSIKSQLPKGFSGEITDQRWNERTSLQKNLPFLCLSQLRKKIHQTKKGKCVLRTEPALKFNSKLMLSFLERICPNALLFSFCATDEEVQAKCFLEHKSKFGEKLTSINYQYH